MYVVIVGGGKIGYYLCKTLLDEGHEVTIVERRPLRADRLERDLGDIVLRGDGARPSVLEQAGCARAEVIVAITGDDATNLLIAQLARQRFNVQRVIARLNNPRNDHLFQALGCANTVSSTQIIAELIEREVATREIKTLLSFKSGEMTMVEIDLPAGAPSVGRQVRDLTLPAGSLLVSVVRGNDIIVPSGATALTPGDRLIAFSSHSAEAELRHTLLGHG